MILLEFDEPRDSVLSRYEIDMQVARNVNRIYDQMPPAEASDLSGRWSAYWSAKYQLQRSREFLESGDYAVKASELGISSDKAHSFLVARIGDLVKTVRSFETYVGDMRKVYA